MAGGPGRWFPQVETFAVGFQRRHREEPPAGAQGRKLSVWYLLRHLLARIDDSIRADSDRLQLLRW